MESVKLFSVVELIKNIKNIISTNNLSELENFVNSNNINFEDFHIAYNVQMIINAIENGASIEMIKYLLQKITLDKLDHFILDNDTKKTPLFSSIGNNNFEVANYFLTQHDSDINSERGAIIDNLYRRNLLNNRNLKFILSHGYEPQYVNSSLIKNLLNTTNNFIETIFKFYIFDNSFILGMLNKYREREPISKRKFKDLIIKEKNKIMITDESYRNAVEKEKHEIVKLFLELDGSSVDTLSHRRLQYSIKKGNSIKNSMNSLNSSKPLSNLREYSLDNISNEEEDDEPELFVFTSNYNEPNLYSPVKTNEWNGFRFINIDNNSGGRNFISDYRSPKNTVSLTSPRSSINPYRYKKFSFDMNSTSPKVRGIPFEFTFSYSLPEKSILEQNKEKLFSDGPRIETNDEEKEIYSIKGLHDEESNIIKFLSSIIYDDENNNKNEELKPYSFSSEFLDKQRDNNIENIKRFDFSFPKQSNSKEANLKEFSFNNATNGNEYDNKSNIFKFKSRDSDNIFRLNHNGIFNDNNSSTNPFKFSYSAPKQTPLYEVNRSKLDEIIRNNNNSNNNNINSKDEENDDDDENYREFIFESPELKNKTSFEPMEDTYTIPNNIYSHSKQNNDHKSIFSFNLASESNAKPKLNLNMTNKKPVSFTFSMPSPSPSPIQDNNQFNFNLYDKNNYKGFMLDNNRNINNNRPERFTISSFAK